MDIDNILQNLKTKSLNYWEEAEAFKNIVDSGISQTKLSHMLGIKSCSVSNKMRILKLPNEVKETIKNHELNERFARILLRIHNKNQQLKIIEHICEFNLNTIAAEKYVNKLLSAARNSRNIKEFISIVGQSVKGLKANGLNVVGKRIENEGYTDLIIRLYK